MMIALLAFVGSSLYSVGSREEPTMHQEVSGSS